MCIRDSLGSGGEMLGRTGAVGEMPSRLHDHVDAQIAPGQCSRVAFGEYLEGLAVDGDAVTLDRNDAGPDTVDTVVLEKVRQSRGIGEVVHGDEIYVGATATSRAQEVPPDTSKTVDTYANAHTPGSFSSDVRAD